MKGRGEKKAGRHPRSSEKGSGAVAGAPRLGDRGWDVAVPGIFLLFTVLLFAAFLFGDKMLFGTDTLPMGYAARKYLTDVWKATGTMPLWNPTILGGIPMVDGLMGGDMFYPTSLLQFLMPVHRALGLKLVIHIFLAGWFFYLFARGKGASRGAGLVGGTSYMFAPYLVSLIYAGHDGKLFVASLLPLGFFALERLLDRARFRDFLLFGFTVGLMILTAHLQLAFFACGAFGLRWIWRLAGDWKRGERKRVIRTTALFFGAAILGVAIGAVQTYPAYRYTSRFSPRAGGVTYEFATSWSIHWEEAVSLVVPEFGNYLGDYWGKNPFKLNAESPGFIAMLFVIAGFFRIRRDRELPFWYALLLITFVYALGAETPFFRLIFMVVPKFFRAPSTILFLFSFAASFTAVRVLDAYWQGKDRRALLTGFGVMGGFLLLILFLVSIGEPFFRIWGALFQEGLVGQRLAAAVANAPNVQAGVLVCLLLGALFIGLAEGARRKRWPREVVALGSALLVFAGAVWTDRHFVKAVRLQDFIRSDGLIRRMQEDDDVFRLLSAVPNLQGNYFSVFGLEAARGFFDNKTRWYDEISGPEHIRNLQVLSLLNVKYIVSGPGVRHGSFDELLTEGGRTLYRNRAVLPRAFLAERWEIVPRESMIGRIESEGFNARETILLEEDPGFVPAPVGEGGGTAPVRWVEYTPNRLVMEIDARRPSLLFVSNAWLPYWGARVDGEEAPVLRGDYAFQAVPVPEGAKEVTLRFRSPPFVAARAVSLGAVAFLLIGAAGTAVISRRRGGVR
ncbi:MAG: hypothetical protein ABIK65_15180 [Candidatus Eisenbacteria bacterium]